MSTHYRVFNERSGNPASDNRNRVANKRWRSVRASFVLRGVSGRKRKKRLTRETFEQLIRLHLAVMKQIHDERSAAAVPVLTPEAGS